MNFEVNYPPKPFVLSAATATSLDELADQLVAESLAASDEFISQGCVVDKVQWKILKKKDNITAYRSRRWGAPKPRPRINSEDTDALAKYPEKPEFYPVTEKNIKSALSSSYLSVSATCPEANDYENKSLEIKMLEKSRPNHAPMVFCTGSVPGSVEDAALGFLADTDFRTKTRTSKCTDANVDNAKILACIEGPSFEDPFRFLGVKWLTLSTPGAAKHFIKSRDYLILESSGMALDSDGERFCYLLIHSIKLDKVPEYGNFGFVRQTFSACHIIRPSGVDRGVQIFSRGFTNYVGKLTERLSMNQYCDVLMTVPQMIEEAYTRKLMWLLQTERQGVGNLRPTLEAQGLDTCHSCNGNLNSGLGKLFDYSICVLCRQSACRKCTVKRSLHREHKRQLPTKFCLKCYLEAKRLSAWRVGVNSLSVAF
ncbi:hypothetical protein GN244_ATG15513 [Phytophthora infestans]|uniref:FYVE-type domain-containing protein n=1 Tax=Phytophthora infestans TaxID=4787 RepID=A0A833S4F5_PHYIN|nr:hypothetical protein GN244_ATG15513 [Phytophthora infestans]KAF4142337.1 hypothetical protein GN958_ATG08513 [Phytophthora infestans]